VHKGQRQQMPFYCVMERDREHRQKFGGQSSTATSGVGRQVRTQTRSGPIIEDFSRQRQKEPGRPEPIAKDVPIEVRHVQFPQCP
jgi:hypothetical protein